MHLLHVKCQINQSLYVFVNPDLYSSCASLPRHTLGVEGPALISTPRGGNLFDILG